MASTNEKTFGTVINNAETLVSHLKSFTNYTPVHPNDGITELEKLITSIRTTNETEASKLQTYTLQVDERQKLINGDETSLKKIITSINGYIKGVYGKESKEATSIGEQINKMRGVKTKKAKANTNEKTVSTSQQSYASIAQALSDLLASLKSLKTYNPPNDVIKSEALQEKLTTIQQATKTVTSVSAELTKIRKERNELYASLKESALRIKEAVKSQYGNRSTEYAFIKGLKF
jgi:chromosome segregation ATPase